MIKKNSKNVKPSKKLYIFDVITNLVFVVILLFIINSLIKKN